MPKRSAKKKPATKMERFMAEAEEIKSGVSKQAKALPGEVAGGLYEESKSFTRHVVGELFKFADTGSKIAVGSDDDSDWPFLEEPKKKGKRGRRRR